MQRNMGAIIKNTAAEKCVGEGKHAESEFIFVLRCDLSRISLFTGVR